MRKFTVCLVSLLLVLLVLTGCDKKDELVIGTEATFAPFEFVNEDNEIVGFDIDLANEIADALDQKLVIKDMKFDGLVTAVQTEKVDLAVAGMTVNEERLQKVSFSTPYFDASQVIVVQDTNTTISSKEDLVGKVIAVQMGTTGADSAEKIADVQLKQFGKVNEAFLELKNGRADAVIIDAPVAENYLEHMGGLKIASEPFTEEKYAIAVNKENEDLLKEVNDVLQDLVESGKYDELYTKWFGEEE